LTIKGVCSSNATAQREGGSRWPVLETSACCPQALPTHVFESRDRSLQITSLQDCQQGLGSIAKLAYPCSCSTPPGDLGSFIRCCNNAQRIIPLSSSPSLSSTPPGNPAFAVNQCGIGAGSSNCSLAKVEVERATALFPHAEGTICLHWKCQPRVPLQHNSQAEVANTTETCTNNSITSPPRTTLMPMSLRWVIALVAARPRCQSLPSPLPHCPADRSDNLPCIVHTANGAATSSATNRATPLTRRGGGSRSFEPLWRSTAWAPWNPEDRGCPTAWRSRHRAPAAPHAATARSPPVRRM